MITYSCPTCKGFFETKHSFSDHLGATTDCPLCDALLVVIPEPVVNHPEWTVGLLAPFHVWLHSQNAEWPEDGKDTASIDIEEKA